MLNQAQYDSKLASVNAIARKVLQSVPIQESWSRQKIKAEMHRVTQATIDGRTIDGCLRVLRETGLIRETSPDYFIQVRPHEKAPKAERMQAHDHHEQEGPDPILEGSGTAINLTEAARAGAAFTLIESVSGRDSFDPEVRLGVLSDRLIEIASELESIRKRVGENLAAANAKGAKLSQLTELLDSLRS